MKPTASQFIRWIVGMRAYDPTCVVGEPKDLERNPVTLYMRIEHLVRFAMLTHDFSTVYVEYVDGGKSHARNHKLPKLLSEIAINTYASDSNTTVTDVVAMLQQNGYNISEPHPLIYDDDIANVARNCARGYWQSWIVDFLVREGYVKYPPYTVNPHCEYRQSYVVSADNLIKRLNKALSRYGLRVIDTYFVQPSEMCGVLPIRPVRCWVVTQI